MSQGTAELEQFVQATKRLEYTGSTWMKVVRGIPFLGSVVTMGSNLIHLKSRFLVSRVMATAGVSTTKLLSEIAFGLFGLAATAFLWALFDPFAAKDGSLDPIGLVLCVILSLLFVPFIASGLATLLGTVAHAKGEGETGFIMNSNLSHLAKRNIFSPKAK